VSKKYMFLSRWDKDILKCSCLKSNPCCDRFKKCEEVELTLDPFADVEKVMRGKAYRRSGGALRQVRQD
jgi:hypothetical protein